MVFTFRGDFILSQLHIMEVHVYNENHELDLFETQTQSQHTIRTLSLTDSITHIAKPPSCHVDIYSEYLAEHYKSNWYVETWIRGHAIEKEHPLVHDIKSITYHEHTFKESQDHSKWAVSDEYYFVGDLNRMTSQFTRGGGGMICKDKERCLQLKSLL